MSRAVQAWLLGLAASSAIGWPDPALAEPPRDAPGGAELDRRSAAELLAEAREAFRALRYRDAVGLLERAWRRGDSSPVQLRAIFALAGRAAASMGRDAVAELWFQRWLCLEPAAELPAGASPKLRGALARARDALAGAVLAVHAVRRGEDVELTIRDPLALAASARTGATRTPLSSLHVTVPVRGEGGRDELELLDTYGNLLVSAAIEPAPAAPAPLPVAPGDPGARDAAWYGRWGPWAIAAGGFATLSVVAWWIADDADHQARDSGDEEEEAALRRRRDVASWVSRGALVAMGVAITAGIVVYVRGDQQVIATPRPGGGGLAWRLTF